MTTKEKAPAKMASTQKMAPPQLATITDIPSDNVLKVTSTVNKLIADSFALYVKTKNFHWHLSGSHFRDYHLLFDEQADAIFASIDPMAERVRRIGGKTIHSIGQIAQLQTVQDNNEDYVSPGDMIRQLMEDNRKSSESYRAAIELCEECKDFATSNTLEELLDLAERRKWFLFEVLQGQNNTD